MTKLIYMYYPQPNKHGIINNDLWITGGLNSIPFWRIRRAVFPTKLAGCASIELRILRGDYVFFAEVEF